MAAPTSNRNIANFMYIVGFLDLFGVSLVIPLLSKHIRELGASPTVAGLIGSAYGFLQLFSSPLVGKWSDVAGRRTVLLCCLFMSALSYALLGMAGSLSLLLLARIPAGCFKHTQNIAKAILADLFPVAKERSKSLGRFNAVGAAGFIVGPSISGHMIDSSLGYRLAAGVAGLIFILNLVLVWLLVPDTEQQRDKKTDSAQSSSIELHPLRFLQSFREIDWANLWDLFLVRFLLGFAMMVYRSNFSMLLDYKYAASSTTIGYITSYGAVIATISGFFVGRIAEYYKGNSAQMLFHTGIVQVLSIGAIAVAPTLEVLILCIAPLSIATAVARVAATNLTIARGEAIAAETHSTATGSGALLGLGASVLSVARMCSPALGGVAQELHISGPPILGAVVSALGVMLMMIVPQDPDLRKIHCVTMQVGHPKDIDDNPVREEVQIHKKNS